MILMWVQWHELHRKGHSGWMVTRRDHLPFRFVSAERLNRIFHKACPGVKQNVEIESLTPRFKYVRMPSGLRREKRRAFHEALERALNLK